MASVSTIVNSVALKVFFSYSHDSAEHDEQVLGLADRLRRDGIDAAIDQYETAPSNGWTRWMREQIECANFVLVICTENYQRRAEGKEEPGKGLGANREGLIIDQEIYEHSGKNEKFIAVLLRSSDSPFIPYFLKPYQHESVEKADVYETLYRRLTHQPAVEKPVLGTRVAMPPRERKTDYRQGDVPKTVAAAGPCVWNIPSFNPFFSGREEYLQDLRNALTTFQPPCRANADLQLFTGNQRPRRHGQDANRSQVRGPLSSRIYCRLVDGGRLARKSGLGLCGIRTAPGSSRERRAGNR